MRGTSSGGEGRGERRWGRRWGWYHAGRGAPVSVRRFYGTHRHYIIPITTIPITILVIIIIVFPQHLW